MDTVLTLHVIIDTVEDMELVQFIILTLILVETEHLKKLFTMMDVNVHVVVDVDMVALVVL